MNVIMNTLIIVYCWLADFIICEGPKLLTPYREMPEIRIV